MTKEQWQALQTQLSSFYANFLKTYSVSQNGKNLKIKILAKTEAAQAISYVRYYISQNNEVEELLKQLVIDSSLQKDFFKPIIFKDEMIRLLERIQVKINSF